ncbi:MAG TPA: ATP-binding cassette domain-containing protein, partial [Caldilineaceae bacterium]|nr:ATP-binding cassette domain-containing protein [Caldilineaceae bacterium]
MKQTLSALDRRLSSWLLPIAILAVWQLAVQVGLAPDRILPAPLKIVNTAIRLTLSGQLLADIAVSTSRALTGLLVGGGIGFALGLLNGMFLRSERYLDTTIQMVRTVPNLALVPLVILWFGIGDQARLFLIALGVFFPIYINTFHGVRQVDTGLIEMGRVYGLTTQQLFWQVILPGAMPSILLGLRVALGVMWLTLIVAETVAVDSGIGYLAQSAREFIRTDVMVFAVILYALLGKLADTLATLPAAGHHGGGCLMTTARGIPLVIHGLEKSFGPKPVLQGINLQVRSGEFIAIVGKSGCGKSTLLRLIAGLGQPDRGEVIVNGQRARSLNPAARIMFQDARLLPWKRVLDNVGLGVAGDWRGQAAEALAHVGLTDRADQWPLVLSGGERQRVALARALLTRPPLLLLDEPLGALDALTRIEMQQLVERLWQEDGFTALLITHDVEEAVALADRVVVIQQGKIALEVAVPLPRPRRHGSAEFAALKEQILNQVL